MNYEKEINDAGLSLQQYDELLEVIRDKKNGLNDLDWSDITREYHLDIASDVLRKANGTIFGGAFVSGYLQEKYPAPVTINASEDQVQQLKNLRLELDMQRVKYRDERNEFNRTIREQARKQSYLEQVEDVIKNHTTPLSFKHKDSIEFVSENEMVVTVFDVHAGMSIETKYNTFNEDVLAERMSQYTNKILSIRDRHGCGRVTVILSELVSGLIHPTLRIENNMNLIEQFLLVCDYVAYMLEEFAINFDHVQVEIAAGNHSRLHENKDLSLRGENMDVLARSYLIAKLQNYTNIEFGKNEFDAQIAEFEVCGNKCVAIHGDKNDMNTIVQKLTMYLGYKPSSIFVGHRHTNSMITSYDTKVIQAGCMSGSGDEYTQDKQLRNKPEQVIAILNHDGLDCLYDVKF